MALIEMTCTAQPGFFAVYKETDGSLNFQPVIGWGRRKESRNRLGDVFDVFPCGVVLEPDTGPEAPEDCSNFAGYISPDRPAPSAAQVAAFRAALGIDP